MHATLRAYRYALQHPEEAIESLAKRSPSIKRDIEIEKLKATGPLLESADTKAHGIGYSSKQKWEATQRLMLEFGGLKKAVEDVSTYYTNEFLPK